MNTFWIVLYLLACPFIWYVVSAIHYGLNGGQIGRHPYLFPFECFAEELKCYWFGGEKYRIEFIKERCKGNGMFGGSRRSYDHHEVREKNLYEEVFWAMMPSRAIFWGGNLFAFFLGPVFVICLMAWVVLGRAGQAIYLLILRPFDKL